MKKTNKRKGRNAVNIVVSAIFGLLIIIQCIIWAITLFKDNSTLNIIGNKPYIATYDGLDFDEGDLIWAKVLKKPEYYAYKDELLFKKYYRNRSEAIVVSSNYYNGMNQVAKDRVEGYKKSVISSLGTIILFFREIYVVMLTIIVTIIVFSIIWISRQKSNDELEDSYKRNRRARDILIISFIVATYISIFLIGKVTPYSGTEIELDPLAMSDDNEKDDNKEEDNKKNDNLSIDADIPVEFSVNENNNSWKQLKKLSIFNNYYFNRESKVAPGVQGRYIYNVKNESSKDMKYTVKMEKQSNYDVNILYKIKKNGEYLNTEYQSLDEINHGEGTITRYGIDIYEVEWKWVDTDHDTEIGENSENVKYNLSIAVSAYYE